MDITDKNWSGKVIDPKEGDTFSYQDKSYVVTDAAKDGGFTKLTCEVLEDWV